MEQGKILYVCLSALYNYTDVLLQSPQIFYYKCLFCNVLKIEKLLTILNQHLYFLL
ncbi:hypothetical protein SAMN05421796_10422 [Chryseobacterium piscicola]|uniref:Uncharacterized protein n=1 Tax=Chryseobacterium piscicola TaxID=551459 RepID=A0A1N7M744_9FLAO|nr:hypothetical protein SAMN05421796_10422 [Chryseobacterium piscicola]